MNKKIPDSLKKEILEALKLELYALELDRAWLNPFVVSLYENIVRKAEGVGVDCAEIVRVRTELLAEKVSAGDDAADTEYEAIDRDNVRRLARAEARIAALLVPRGFGPISGRFAAMGSIGYVNRTTYHGSDVITVRHHLVKGAIKVNRGSGELGKGFYLGNRLYIAKAWAYNRCKVRNQMPKVLQVTLGPGFVARNSLAVICVPPRVGHRLWSILRMTNRMHTHTYGSDIVQSLILGNVMPSLKAYLRLRAPWLNTRAGALVSACVHQASNAQQWKWESSLAESHLNSSLVVRSELSV